MKNVVPLSDVVLRNIKPTQTKRLTYINSLYLLPNLKGGAHCWRVDYTFNQARNTLSLGTYPEVSLKLARERAAEVRSLAASGVNPSALRKEAKQRAIAERELKLAVESGKPLPGTFEDVSREWFALKSPEWAESYSEKVIRRLEVDVFPWVGKMPICDITAPDMLAVLRKIEERGVVETAHRAKESCSQIFRHAINTGRAKYNPTQDLKGALKKPKSRNFAAFTCPDKLGELLRAIDGYSGSHIVRTALKLAPMLMVRPGELRFADWSEFNLEKGLWVIPSARMKRIKSEKEKGDPHIVLLPKQAVALLTKLHVLTGPTGFVFPGERDHSRAISENTINAALRRMGYDTQTEMTGHGFRATARTILEEELDWKPKYMEAQLAHSVPDSLGTAYNRTKFLVMRRRMLQAWADYLDKLKSNNPRTAGNLSSEDTSGTFTFAGIRFSESMSV